MIPVVDVSGAVDGTDIKTVAQAFAVSRAFFDLPVAEKKTVVVNTDQRGWMAQGMSHLQGATSKAFHSTKTNGQDKAGISKACNGNHRHFEKLWGDCSTI